jgi:hypothetical protein
LLVMRIEAMNHAKQNAGVKKIAHSIVIVVNIGAGKIGG